jgi:oligopeptide transport system substrate-binding protein
MKMRARQLRVVFSLPLVAGVLALLLMCGCARERPVESAAREGLLLVGNGPEPQALDPHVTTGLSELAIQMAVFEGLVSPHPETLEPVPAVAASWTCSEDGLTWRFRIRDSARWSDGTPVAAADFVAAWERALNPAQGTPYAHMLYVLKGAEAYNRSETVGFADVGVKAVDAGILEVRLERPVAYFLSLLMHPVWYPIPSHLGQSSTTSGRVGQWTNPDSFVGNGPFTLKEWLPNQYLEVERNPMYWDLDTVKLQGIRFYAIDEPGAEERAFLSGQLHITDALPPARVAAYRREQSELLRIDPILGTYYILPNVREGVLSDPRVRRALSLSIDRKAIVDNLLGAGQLPAAGFVPPNMPGYGSTATLAHDPATARALLAEAGYPGGKGFPVIEYLLNSSESHRKIGEALQGMWRDELGIEIQLVNQEWRTYLQRRASSDFQLARASWMGDYAEPSTFLDLWTADSGNNWAGWVNAGYDALMASARDAVDPAQRMRLYRQAEEVLIRDQAIIPLYHYVTVYLKDPALQGWSSNILDWHPVKYLYFDDAEKL